MTQSTQYEAPRVVDYGSITQHTFTRSPAPCGPNPPPKDFRVCELDKFCEYTCSP